MEHLFTSEGLISLLTLTLLEIVLGVDNVVFVAIISSKLPTSQQNKARNYGLILAIIPRLILLFFLTWLMGLKDELLSLTLFGHNIHLTEKGIILALGGIFLIYKATSEIHQKLEGTDANSDTPKSTFSFSSAILQTMLVNIVFSLDSVLTAVGLAKHVEVMIVAVILSSLIMMLFAAKISHFVETYPTVKMLALSFLLMIGFLLVTESIVVDNQEIHVPKGYVYFAMGFSLFVEMLNLRMQKKRKTVKLHKPFEE
ncbi:MAG: TerC family protein [Microscillaceae bacterium]|nr:TerC family protein [Microscillaceae bacterium]MDW8459984.1 TerC family protein [Cytophagales bacterium]